MTAPPIEHAASPDKSAPAFDDKLFSAYEDGKHRRYTLLFTVNGGAFAVAKLLGERGGEGVGGLTTARLAVGLILFTTVMSFDIAMFGYKVRKLAKKVSTNPPTSKWDGPFAVPGWLVLGAIWGLIIVGWGLVACGRPAGAAREDNAMQADIDELIRLNEDIGAAENAGDLTRLGDMVATSLAFQRRDGTVVDRKEYLSKAKPGNRVTAIRSIHLHGNRAVVTCLITDAGTPTHNVRLFIRKENKWRLLGWANEPG